VSELLTTLVSRFLRDRDAFMRNWKDPVLLFKPRGLPPGVPEGDPDEDRYRLQTASGVGVPSFGGQESLIFPVRKVRENAFPRGITVGRTRNNDVILEDASVSRFHAWFARIEPEGPWQLTDAGSRNGTSVDSESLVPRKSCYLRDGAQLEVGRIHLTFLLPEGLFSLLRGPGPGGGGAGSLHTSGRVA
jgi:hypothetical protein